MKQKADFSKNLRKHIKTRDKEVTILFTDIVSSGKYWDSRGDLSGRVMVHEHNHVFFPIVKEHRGKVIKTIGDALMVSFKKPLHALQAAIAMQQALQRERKKNKNFPKVRIGIHSGRAIVEKQDVYGDMVNVASRIVNKARSNEIVISAKAARGLSRKKYRLEKKTRFKPKGKKTEITLYQSHWQKVTSLIDDLNLEHRLLLTPLQKLEIGGAVLGSLAALIALYFKYFRYLLSDSENIALIGLNPLLLLTDFPFIAVPIAGLIAYGIYRLIRMKTVPLSFFKLIHGGLGFFIGFTLLYLAASLFPIHRILDGNKILYESNHLFVEVVDNDGTIHASTSQNSAVLRSVSKGTLLLQVNYLRRNDAIWNKVLIGKQEYGWILRIRPPAMGVVEKRITKASKFLFRRLDVYILALSFIAFIWGFFRFRVRPT